MKVPHKKRRAVRLVFLGGATALASCSSPPPQDTASSLAAPFETPPAGSLTPCSVVCADGETTFGIDVSYWQGSIDWDRVASDGVEFAFIRAANGLSLDDYFSSNWEQARDAGIIRGAYQYFHPGTDGVTQAERLLEHMGALEDGDLPPVLDIETTDGVSQSTATAAIQDWMDTVEAEIGRKPIIYTSIYYWGLVSGSDDFADYPLWVANWGVSCPDIPDQWSRWDFWQTGDTGSVAGISGYVDTDVFNGDLLALLDFAQGDFQCGDGICNGDETWETCPEDCPACEPVPAEGAIIDETDTCFQRGGNDAYWYEADAGWGGSLLWTHTTDSAEVDNHGIWTLDFQYSGSYLVQVYTDTSWAQARQALYQVHHAAGFDSVILDQSALDGWRDLGTWDFTPGLDQWIRLDDNTGEPYSTRTQIVFDALRLVPTDLEDSAQPQDSGTAQGSDTGDTGYSYVLPGTPERPRSFEDEPGCGCATFQEGAGPGLVRLVPTFLSLLLAPFIVRRRGTGDKSGQPSAGS